MKNIINKLKNKHFIFILVLDAFLLTSCSQERNMNLNNKTRNIVIDTSEVSISNKPEKLDIDTLTVISSKDTKIQIRKKLKKSAELDQMEFGENIFYDDYFNDEITKFSIKNNEGRRILTAVVYQDRIRYMKIFIQHVSDTTIENKEEKLKRTKEDLEKAIEVGIYQITNDTYLKLNENGDIWYNAFIISESKKTRKQNYWNMMAPEADFEYLKHMVNSFKSEEGFETKFIIDM